MPGPLFTFAAYLGAVMGPAPKNRGGSVCLNSRLAAAKWISAMVMLQPRLAAAQ